MSEVARLRPVASWLAAFTFAGMLAPSDVRGQSQAEGVPPSQMRSTLDGVFIWTR